MNTHILELSAQIRELQTVIEPYKLRNSSAARIQKIFKEINDIMVQVNDWMEHNIGEDIRPVNKRTKTIFTCCDREKRDNVLPTHVHFKVPDPKRANMGLYEGCSAYYIDKLTKAYVNNDQQEANNAIYSLLDIGKAYDREMDPETEASGMLTDEDLRADSAKCEYWRKLKYPDDDLP